MGALQGANYASNTFFRDTIMSPQAGTSPFQAFPMLALASGPGSGIFVYDDFITLQNVATTGLWLATKGTGGSVALSADSNLTSDGWLKFPTAGSGSDYIMYSTQKPVFAGPQAVGLDMAFEACVQLTEASTNAASWYAGFTSVVTSGWIQTSGVPNANYSGVMFWKATGGLLLKCQTSNATTQSSSGTLATVVSGTTYIIGATINHNDGVTALVTPYVCKVASNVRTLVGVGPVQNLTIASLANMYFGFGVMCGSGGTAETLYVDYVAAAQGKFYQ